MPATRPCLLATVPRATWTNWPVTRWKLSQQSPAAHTSGALVRCRRSTRMAPRWPTAMPASSARREVGATPGPRTTRAAGRDAALDVWTGAAGAAGEAGRWGEAGVGGAAGAEDDEVGGKGLAARRVDGVRLEGVDALVAVDVDAVLAHGVGDERPHVLVERGHRLVRRRHD